MTYSHIVQFVLVCTPHCVCKIIVLANDSHVLVCVVREVRLSKECVALDEILAPELDVYVFALVVLFQQILSYRDWLAIKIFSERDACEGEQSRYDIGVARWNVLHGTFRHTGSANKERDVDIFFNVTALAWRETVLADVVAVVSCVDQIGIVENCGIGRQATNNGVNKFINRLQRLEALAVPVVIVVDLALVQLANCLEV